MKFNRILGALTALLAFFALSFPATAQQSINYSAQAGVSFITGVSATATQTSGAVRLPDFSGTGYLNVSETGITGSPSGCTLALAYQANNGTNTTTAATISFTPSTGLQQLAVSPTAATGDNYVLTYACSSAYPTAGSISVSFSPVHAASADPCFTSLKSSAVVSSVTTLAQIVPLSTGKKIYVCGLNVSVGTAGTVQLEYGTGSNCGTGTTALTGSYNLAVGIPALPAGAGTIVSTPASDALCLNAGEAASGVVTYVQQ